MLQYSNFSSSSYWLVYLTYFFLVCILHDQTKGKKGTSVNTNMALYSIKGSLEIMSTVPSGNTNKNLVFDNLRQQTNFANPNIFLHLNSIKSKVE